MTLERFVIKEANLTHHSIKELLTRYNGAAPLYIHTNCYVNWDGERMEWVHKLVDFKGRWPVYSTELYKVSDAQEGDGRTL